MSISRLEQINVATKIVVELTEQAYAGMPLPSLFWKSVPNVIRNYTYSIVNEGLIRQ
jgi:hypothetical protein